MDATELISKGFTPEELYAGGFTVVELEKADISATWLAVNAECNPNDDKCNSQLYLACDRQVYKCRYASDIAASQSSKANPVGSIVGGVVGLAALFGIGFFIYQMQSATSGNVVVAAQLSSFTVNPQRAPPSSPPHDHGASQMYAEVTEFNEAPAVASSNSLRTPAETSFYDEIDNAADDTNGSSTQTVTDKYAGMSRLRLLAACKAQGLLNQLTTEGKRSEAEMRAVLVAADTATTASLGPQSLYEESSSRQRQLYDDGKAIGAGGGAYSEITETATAAAYADVDDERTPYTQFNTTTQPTGKKHRAPVHALNPVQGSGEGIFGKRRNTVGENDQCQRPAPNGGTCKTPKLKGSQLCTSHRCTHPKCEHSKSGTARACPAHTHAGLRVAPVDAKYVNDSGIAANYTDATDDDLEI